jgi:iron-sulfur cluster repair protein YtfE (RIC family)
MSQQSITQIPITEILIRDLVEQYPDTMRVLSPLGIDLCCGGGHPLGEALDLHEIDRATVLPQIEQIVATQSGQKG